MKRVFESNYFWCLIISLLFFFICLAGCEKVQEKKPAEVQEKIQSIEQSSAAVKKRVLYINSYHRGYEWSDAIEIAILQVFNVPAADIAAQKEGVGDVRLRVVYMDSKRQSTAAYLQEKGLEIKGIVENWQPDVVITSDDNAARYVIAPYFRNSTIPFVFCGINWDASEYGLPAANVTGMLEVQLIDEILVYLKTLAKGAKVGYLKGDDTSARKEAAFYEDRFALSLDSRFVKNFAEWKKEYLALQQEVDMLLLGNVSSISDWNAKEGKELVYANTLIPSGNWDAWMAPYALMTFATKPEEQGKWAAETAKEILAGKTPSSIAVVQNVVAHVVLNMQLAKKMGVKFPINLVEQAELLDSPP